MPEKEGMALRLHPWKKTGVLLGTNLWCSTANSGRAPTSICLPTGFFSINPSQLCQGHWAHNNFSSPYLFSCRNESNCFDKTRKHSFNQIVVVIYRFTQVLICIPYCSHTLHSRRKRLIWIDFIKPNCLTLTSLTYFTGHGKDQVSDVGELKDCLFPHFTSSYESKG